MSSSESSVEWAFEDSKRHPLDRDFKIGRELGEGKFSVVVHATHLKSGKDVAIKCIDRINTNPDELVHEAMLIQLVEDHPGIIKILDVYEDCKNYYLVMEYVTGGELFDKIVEAEFYSEKEAATIVRQITEIVKYVHSKGVVHRDLKPENLLYADKEATELKLCDFGLADTIEDDELLTAIVGSTTYMAPEVANGEGYDKSVDMYSIGVVLYILLCGYPPFEPEAGIIDLEFPRKEWKDISKPVITLITRLLSSDPDDRPTAKQFLDHGWVRGESVSTRRLNGTIKTMRQYNVARKSGESMRKKDAVTKNTVWTIFDDPSTLSAETTHSAEEITTSTAAGCKKNNKRATKEAKKEAKKKGREKKRGKDRKDEKDLCNLKSVGFSIGDNSVQVSTLQQQLEAEKKKVTSLEAELKELRKLVQPVKDNPKKGGLVGKSAKKGKKK